VIGATGHGFVAFAKEGDGTPGKGGEKIEDIFGKGRGDMRMGGTL
jgi:hypothetical protein